MGCDIHTIVEIKKNEKWEYVPDLPSAFDDRNYGVFSILNRNVRNYNGKDGFEGKGLPTDLSGRQFRFSSCRQELESAYNKSTLVCVDGNGNFVYVYDESLTTEISEELFNKIKDLIAEKNDEYCLRYYMPMKDSRHKKFFVQDAQKVNGKFIWLPFKEIYKTIDEFNKAYCNYPWCEKENDYGYYDVDFDGDLHSASYLTLTELKTKVFNISSDKTFIVNKEFINCLKEELGELPETMVVEDLKDNKVKVSFGIDPDDFYPQESYNKGVKELENIKEKYNVKSDEDLRIVFAFDS